LPGLGLIRSKAEVTVGAEADEAQNDFGYDVGGGVMIFFGKHVGARADVRYFHSFNVLHLLDLDSLRDNKLDFGRFSAGVVFKF
jgi:opacity protein-like surface antigen